MARKARVKSSTGIYHMILRGFEMKNVFLQQDEKEKFLEILSDYKDVCGYQVYGYVLMDNHVHLLIKEGNVSIGNMIKRIGVKYVTWYHAKYDMNGRVFHDRFKSEPVEDNKYLLTVLRCIHQEPVRVGLTTEVSRYIWSSFEAYLGKSVLVDTEICLGLFGEDEKRQRVRWQKFMTEPTEEKCLEAVRKNINDEDLQQILLRLASVKTIEALSKLPKTARNQVLQAAKAIDGVSTWQLARISKLSQSVISRI